MSFSKLRRQIAFEAARLIYEQQEFDYQRAKMKAARRVAGSWVKPIDLPRHGEISAELRSMARSLEGSRDDNRLQRMREEALAMMRILAPWQPRLVGSVVTGQIRMDSDINLRAFAEHPDPISAALRRAGWAASVMQRQIPGREKTRVVRSIHVQREFPVEIRMQSPDDARHVFRSSLTGKPMDYLTLPQLEQLVGATCVPDQPSDSLEALGSYLSPEAEVLRWNLYRGLLLPLEHIVPPRFEHPEGDLLYHSLQVFTLAVAARNYDEEFLTAALLHDVGMALDISAPVDAALEALHGYVTERTAWFIEHLPQANDLVSGALGLRAARRLHQSPDIEDLILLNQLDRRGRKPGANVPDVDAALEQIQRLADDLLL